MLIANLSLGAIPVVAVYFVSQHPLSTHREHEVWSQETIFSRLLLNRYGEKDT